LHAKGTEKSLELAVKYFQLAALAGNPKAQYSLGFMYQMGEGGNSPY